MGYKRLYILRKDLHMSAGKLAAQVGHCSEAYWINLLKNGLVECMLSSCYMQITAGIPKASMLEYGLKDMTKVICQAKNKNQLLKAVDIANELGLHEDEDYGFIYDKCFTELTPEEADGTTLTGIWFRPMSEDMAHKISSKYHLYVG